MWRDRIVRRVDVRESWRRAKAQFAAVKGERDVLKQECEALAWEIDVLKAQLAESKTTIREMQAATLARYEAWSELTELHRERQIELARKAERQPGELLH